MEEEEVKLEGNVHKYPIKVRLNWLFGRAQCVLSADFNRSVRKRGVGAEQHGVCLPLDLLFFFSCCYAQRVGVAGGILGFYGRLALATSATDQNPAKKTTLTNMSRMIIQLSPVYSLSLSVSVGVWRKKRRPRWMGINFASNRTYLSLAGGVIQHIGIPGKWWR